MPDDSERDQQGHQSGDRGTPDALVLDLGGDVGALIVYVPEEYVGLEIDLTPVGEQRSHKVHTAVRRHRLIVGTVCAGVYPDVVSGDYTVWGPQGPFGNVTVHGGAAAEFHAAGRVAT